MNRSMTMHRTAQRHRSYFRIIAFVTLGLMTGILLSSLAAFITPANDGGRSHNAYAVYPPDPHTTQSIHISSNPLPSPFKHTQHPYSYRYRSPIDVDDSEVDRYISTMSDAEYESYVSERYHESLLYHEMQAMELAEAFRVYDMYVIWEIPYSHCVGFAVEMIHLVAGLYKYIPERIGIIAGGGHTWCRGLSPRIVDVLNQMANQDMSSWLPNVIHIHHTVPTLYQPFPRAGSNCHDGVCNDYMIDLSSVSYRIGRAMIETTTIPNSWKGILNTHVDEIWVPASAIVDAFTSGGIERSMINVLPEPIDDSIYALSPHNIMKELRLRDTSSSPSPARFLSSGKLEARKGWDILVEAFIDEFSPDERVDLWLHTYFTGHTQPSTATGERDHDAISKYVYDYASSVVQRAYGYSNGNPSSSARRWNRGDIERHIHIISGEMSATSMLRLYATMSAFVLPTHGEGWGLPIADAMAAGLPTIATNCSGQTEFMNDRNSFLIPVKSIVKADIPFDGDEAWPMPDTSKLKEMMREVYKYHHNEQRHSNKQEHHHNINDIIDNNDSPMNMNMGMDVNGVRMRGRRARIDMLTKYSVDAVAIHTLQRLLDVAQKIDESSAICIMQSTSVDLADGGATCCFRAQRVLANGQKVRDAAYDAGCYDNIMDVDAEGYCQCQDSREIYITGSESIHPCAVHCTQPSKRTTYWSHVDLRSHN